MKIQIINCLDLLYPYQVMRIVKKTSSCELVYDVKEKYSSSSSDAVIIITRNEQDAVSWVETMFDERNVIWFVPEQIEGKCCWVMPKAFEKEFDFEKFVQYLFCIVSRNPEMNLMKSCQISSFKISKEATISECLCKAEKKQKKKETVQLYVFIKDKVKRFLPDDQALIPVQQFWIKGIAQEAEVVVCKTKNWAR